MTKSFINKILFLTVLSVLTFNILPGLFSGLLNEGSKVFIGLESEKKERLEILKKDLAALQESQKAVEKIQNRIDWVKKPLSQIDLELTRTGLSEIDQEFFNKKRSLLNEIRQMFNSILLEGKELTSIVERHIDFYEGYLKDPDLSSFSLPQESFYTMHTLRHVTQQLLDQEDRVHQIKEKKSKIEKDINLHERVLQAAQKNYGLRKKMQEEFATREDFKGVDEELELFTFKQQGEILDLQVNMYEVEKELANLRLEIDKRRRSLIDSTLSFEKGKLSRFVENLERVKSRLRVERSDIQEAKEKLARTKQKSLSQREVYLRQKQKLSDAREHLIDVLQKQGKVTIDVRAEAAWKMETDSVEAYQTQCRLGFQHEQLLLLDYRINLLDAKIDFERVSIQHEEINVDVIVTWLKISQRAFKDNEELAEEIKKFKQYENDLERELSSLNDRRAEVTNQLNLQNKGLTNLRNAIDEFKQFIEKEFDNTASACLKQLREVEAVINQEIEISGKLIEIYSNTVVVLNSSLKDVKVVNAELTTKSIWQRSEYAIHWYGIKNIIPDLLQFFADVYHMGISYFSSLRLHHVIARLDYLIGSTGKLLLFLLNLFALIVLYILLRRSFPRLWKFLLHVQSDYNAINRIAKVMAAVIQFISQHITSLYIWWCVYILIKATVFDLPVITEVFPRIFFYLLSIPYFLYIARAFLMHMLNFNKAHEYVLFQASFERRFKYVLSLLIYTSILILFFREAFILATIHKSELPSILLALYSIIARTVIIFSIGKSDIIGLLPQRGVFWQWLAAIINRYYYLLLGLIILLMILSDPYVGGYRNLVSYIMWGLIGSVFLLWGLSILHYYTKRLSSLLFFYKEKEDEIIKERFTYSKTWYGLFTILSFIILGIFGIFIGLHIWGVPVSLHQIYESIANTHLFRTGVVTEAGEIDYLTPFELGAVVCFIVGGIVTSYAVNRFVLRRIFEVLPVDLGIQNTVMSLMRLFIIVLSILIGFLWANLGTLLLALGVVVGSIGYFVKEPISDLISYFIILVQRPIQIGDFIKIDEENQGVVRQITPRAVILRAKNSHTVIVPNSAMVAQPIINWNYARNFVAFDDILFTLPYNVDPLLVREIIATVLEQNHNVLRSPQPIIRLHEFGEYGFIFLVRGFVTSKNILNKWDIASDMRFSIVKALREHDIKIAIPARAILERKPLE